MSDVGFEPPKPQNLTIKLSPKPKTAEDHGASRTVCPDADVLVSDHSIVLRIASSNSSETDLSKDTICNMIKWFFVGVEITL